MKNPDHVGAEEKNPPIQEADIFLLQGVYFPLSSAKDLTAKKLKGTVLLSHSPLFVSCQALFEKQLRTRPEQKNVLL